MSKFNAARVSKVISAEGYGPKAIRDGLAYATERGATSDNAAFCLALSRILYADFQLADGEIFDGDIDEAEAAIAGPPDYIP